MTLPVASQEPTELRAGVQWEWTRDFSTDFPADAGWSLKYWFKKTGATPGNFSIDATASGKQFAVTVLAAASAAFVAGDYTWVAVITKAGELRQVDAGRLKILPRYDQVANIDDRSHARKVLEALNAVLEARATSTQRELVAFTIGARSQTFDNTETKLKILEFKSRYEWLVFDEDNAAGLARGEPNKRLIGVRFGQA